MDTLLFSGRSIWTMIHGVALGGLALTALAAAVFALHVMRAPASGDPDGAVERQSRSLAIDPRRAYAVTLVLVALGIILSFPPLWALV